MLAVLSFGSQALAPGAVHRSPHRVVGRSRASTIRCADESYDYLVIGGGSGGIASGRRAAAHGAKVAVIEKARLGGTCVNVGCVPKKVMFNAATILEMIHQAAGYGYTVGETSFSLPELKKRRDAYVARLNGIYQSNLKNSGVELIVGDAKFVGPKTVAVGDKTCAGLVAARRLGGATARRPGILGLALHAACRTLCTRGGHGPNGPNGCGCGGGEGSVRPGRGHRCRSLRTAQVHGQEP